MPPVLTEPPTRPVLATLFVEIPAAASAFAWALLLSAPAGVVIWPVVLTPVPGDVPLTPVVAPAPTPPPAVLPAPAAIAGSATRTELQSSPDMQALFKMLFMRSSFSGPER